jgi:AraC-like DNA-binding protein
MGLDTSDLLQRAAGLLRRHPPLRTRDADELGEYLRVWGYQLEIGRKDARQLNARFNSVFLPRMWLGYYRYGAKVSIRTGSTNDSYWILRPLRAPIEMTSGKIGVNCGPSCAAVISPTRTSLFRSHGGGTRLQLRLNSAALTRQLVVLLGEFPTRPLEFAPAMDLNGGYGRSLAAHLRLAVADIQQRGSILRDPITLHSFEEFILTGLLLSHPHNYSDALLRADKPIAPRDVKRVIDYLNENLNSAIGLPDIVAASGVPGRTLFQHFRDFEGMSPMRYLRTLRFARARELLRSGPSEESLAEIAGSLGFTHLGRFSVEYRLRFGEKPSETRRRRGKLGSRYR